MISVYRLLLMIPMLPLLLIPLLLRMMIPMPLPLSLLLLLPLLPLLLLLSLSLRDSEKSSLLVSVSLAVFAVTLLLPAPKILRSMCLCVFCSLCFNSCDKVQDPQPYKTVGVTIVSEYCSFCFSE